MKSDSKTKTSLSYFSEVKAELTKVTWPNKDQVVRLSVIVVVVSVATSIYLGFLDFAFTSALNAILSR